jgi:hypothetical protein
MLKKDPIPCSGSEGLEEKAPPLSGGEKLAREGSGPLPKVEDARHVADESRGEISCLPPGMCMEDAQRKSKRQKVHGLMHDTTD